MSVEDFFEFEKGITVDAAFKCRAKYTSVDMCRFADVYHNMITEPKSGPRFTVKFFFGSWSVVDKETGKVVEQYIRESDAVLTSDGLNVIKERQELILIINHLKTDKGYGYFLNDVQNHQ